MRPKIKAKAKAKKIIRQAETLNLYLATSQILNQNQKVWSGIITTPKQKILARFNNHQVVRPLEAKSYLILRTIYWLIENKHKKALLFTDNSNIYHRFLKLSSLPLEKGYTLEPEFRLTQRGKIPWPSYLWLARKLIAENCLKITLKYLSPTQNPTTLLTKLLKVCAKCHCLKYLAPNKRNCSQCWKNSRKKQYERWLAWREEQAKEQAKLNKSCEKKK